MASSVIDLAKFVRGDVEKARRRKPDSGLTVSGWNATPEGRDHPKDARGRWTDNPVGQAIAGAYSRVRASYGNEWVGLADLREEIGLQFTREEIDSELRRLGAGNGDPDIRIEEETNQKTLSMRDRMAALSMGGGDLHVISIGGDLSAPSDRDRERREENTLAAARRSFTEVASDPFSPERVQERVKENRARLGDTLREYSRGLNEWDDAELQRAQAAANEFSRAIEMELFRRKGDALNPPKPKKVTARLTAKPKPDYGGLAARMRASTSSEEADAHLEGLTVPQLKELARELGISPGSARKADLRRRLVDHTVGFKLDADAIARMDLSRESPRRHVGGAGDSSARARTLTRPDVTREEVDAAMEGMTVAQLKELAAELAAAGAPISAKGTKEQIKQAIREGTYGFRDRAAAIGGWGRR